jgi:hypothetical protein
MTLIATPAAADANSYCTEAEATAYLTDQRLGADAWTAATSGDREKALIWATSLLDRMMIWKGTIRTNTQRLSWPRAGVQDADGRWYDYDTIPELLKRATAEFALSLIEGNRTDQEPDVLGLGISEATIGPLKIKIDRGEVLSVFPPHVLSLLALLGEPIGGSGGSWKQRRLVRT